MQIFATITRKPPETSRIFVEVCNSEGPSEMIDDLETDDDLSYWLEEFRSTSVTA